MGSFIFFVVKVCLVLGAAAGSENVEDPKSPMAVPVEDTLEYIEIIASQDEDIDESMEELEDIDESVEAPEDIGSRSIIYGPSRPCPYCQRPDTRGKCRPILGCSRDAESGRHILEVPPRPPLCPPCYKRDNRGLCRRVVGCRS